MLLTDWYLWSWWPRLFWKGSLETTAVNAWFYQVDFCHLIMCKNKCAIKMDFRLQFKDPLFNNEFMNLTSVDDLKDHGTIRVIHMADTSTPQPVEVQISSGRACNYSFLEENSFVSSRSTDTDILSSPESYTSTSSTSRTFWPSTFSVPLFGFDAELKL